MKARIVAVLLLVALLIPLHVLAQEATFLPVLIRDTGVVNTAPSFVKGPDVITLEDAGPQSIPGWATAISPGTDPREAGQVLTFVLVADDPSLFSALAVSSNGTLQYTPDPDANGSTQVTVTLRDSGGTRYGGVDTSAPQTFQITVQAVNDPPTFTMGPDQAVLEDSAETIVPNWATGMSAGPSDEEGQTLAFEMSAVNPALFASGPTLSADGTLRFRPALNANGSADVTVRLRDSDGAVSTEVTFAITVAPVNDPPTFAAGADLFVAQNAPPQSLAWALNPSPGPTDEAGQAIAFGVTTTLLGDVTALFTPDGQPALSPTGQLTFTPLPNANGQAQVTVTLTDDGGTADGGNNASPPHVLTITIVPPIAFASDRDGNNEIYLMDWDGANPVRMTNDAASDTQPAWSPDGMHIAFTSDRDPVDGDNDIYVLSWDETLGWGGAPVLLTDDSGLPADDHSPAWSPDGLQIAFTTDRDGNSEVYVMDAADGANPTNLTNHAAEDLDPAWFPDGRIAFTTDRDGNLEIYEMAGDGAEPANLTNNAAADTHPAVSLDGTSVAFVSDRAATGFPQVFILNTQLNTATRLPNTSDDEHSPAWSPETVLRLAFTTSRDGDMEIYTQSMEEIDLPLQSTNLTNDPSNDFDPDWLPGG